MTHPTFFTARISGFRQKTHAGRPYLVAPAVAAVAGVLNGQLLPAKELSAYVEAWNNRPVVLGHPKRNGTHVSANTPDVLEAESIGKVFNPRFVKDRLKVDVWVDVRKTKRNDEGKRLLKRMRAGDMIEVSTAYFRDVEDTQGTHNGEQYDGVQRNIRPDHFALLLHDEGACSIEDGCGFPRTNVDHTEPAVQTLRQARTPTYDGTETSEWSAPTLADYRAGLDLADDARWDDLSRSDRQDIVSHTLLGEASADTFGDADVLPVVNPRTGRLNENALESANALASRVSGIADTTATSAQRKATQLLSEEFDRDMGNETTDARAILDTVTNALRTAYGYDPIPTGNDESDEAEDTPETGQSQTADKEGESDMLRDTMIDALVDNEDCECDRAELEALEDEDLLARYTEAMQPAATNDDDAGDGDSEPAPETNDDTSAETSDDANPDTYTGGSGEMPAWAQTLTETVQDLGTKVQNLEGQVTANANRGKREVAERLAANERCPLEMDDLMALSEDKLRDLEQQFSGADYRGRGGRRTITGTADDAEATPSMPATNEDLKGETT